MWLVGLSIGLKSDLSVRDLRQQLPFYLSIDLYAG
jgi:hypothetical protein